MAAYSHSTREPLAVDKFQVALTYTLPRRCAEIQYIIQETSLKELQSLFPMLIEGIFGYPNQPSWGINNISKTYQQPEFEAMMHFLSPQGPVFNLIYRLMEPGGIQYEFQWNSLPQTSQRILEEGCSIPLYAGKVHLQTRSINMPIVLLNPMEYYLFHFAYFLVNSYHQKTVAWSVYGESVYSYLVENYLMTFLPCDGRSVPAIHWPIRTLPHDNNSALRLGDRSMMSPRMAPLSPTNLLRSNHGATSFNPLPEPVQSETWRSEILVEILCEFWLKSGGHDNSVTSRIQSSPLSHQVNDPWLQEHPPQQHYRPFFHTEVSIPSGDHIRLVRTLVKQLHYFANSAGQYPGDPLNELKRSVVSRHLQNKLYGFIVYAFQVWPLDTSFRLILETWLSYIQPWRYVGNQPLTQEQLDEKDKSVDLKWQQFIMDNLLFYTSVFLQVLPSLQRMDMATPKNAHMVYRISKVYSQPNLRDMIESAECAREEFSCSQYGGSGPSLSPNCTTNKVLGTSWGPPATPILCTTFRQRPADNRGLPPTYQPLFCDKSQVQVMQLISQMEQASRSVRESRELQRIEREKEDHSRGFLATFYHSVTDFLLLDSRHDTATSSQENNRLESHLEAAITQLCNFFKIQQLPKPTGLLSTPTRSPLNTSLPFKPDSPRYPDTSYHGNPDLQPIRSYEIVPLVRILHHVSSCINEKYGPTITTVYHKPGLFGRLAQQFLQPPTECYRYIKSPSPGLHKFTLPARLCLRSLASQQALGVVLACMGIAYMYGLGPVTLILVTAVCAVIWAVINAAMTPLVH